MKRSDAKRKRPAAEPEALPASLGGSGSGERREASSDEEALVLHKVDHDPHNEQILLAAMCKLERPQRRDLLRQAKPDFFFGKGHRTFVATVDEMTAKGLDFSLATVRELAGPSLDAEYFERLLARHPEPPPNLSHHVERLRWDAARIENVHGGLQDLLDHFRNPRTEPAVLSTLARRIAESIEQAAPSSGIVDPSALLAQNRAAYAARKLREPIWSYGIAPDFERPAKQGKWLVKPGAIAKDVTVLTGNSGSGKSIVVKGIAIGQAILGRRVLFGAFEEMSGPVLEAMAQMALALDRDVVDEGRLLPEDEARFFAMQEELAASIKFLRKPPREGPKLKVTTESRIDWVFSEAARIGADVIALDLFSRLLYSTKPEYEQKAWEHLQDCTRESDCHVIATHQQRLKAVEARADARPTREGAKGSAGVVETADTMIGVYRPALTMRVPDDSMELILLKQRKGRWPIAIRLDYDPARTRLSNPREIEYIRPGEEAADDLVPRPGRRSGR